MTRSITKIFIHVLLSLPVFCGSLLAAGTALPSGPAWANGQAVYYDCNIFKNGALERTQKFRWAIFGPIAISNTAQQAFFFEVAALDPPVDQQLTLSIPLIDQPFGAYQLAIAFQGFFSKLGGSLYYWSIGGISPPFGAQFTATEMQSILTSYHNVFAGMTTRNGVSISTTAGTFDTTLFEYLGNKNTRSELAKLDIFSNQTIPITGTVKYSSVVWQKNQSGDFDQVDTEITLDHFQPSGALPMLANGPSFDVKPF
jgi:hypothetical protein